MSPIDDTVVFLGETSRKEYAGNMLTFSNNEWVSFRIPHTMEYVSNVFF